MGCSLGRKVFSVPRDISTPPCSDALPQQGLQGGRSKDCTEQRGDGARAPPPGEWQVCLGPLRARAAQASCQEQGSVAEGSSKARPGSADLVCGATEVPEQLIKVVTEGSGDWGQV